ncbi:MAG: hypothetical protein GF313_12685 [Caldithrix sp.]|nr:hypothetical protein [Caldithrix sp.]
MITSPFLLIYIGLSGILLVIFYLIYMVFLRKHKPSKRNRAIVLKTITGRLITLLFIVLLCIALIFIGAFLHGYNVFTTLQPVAEISVQPYNDNDQLAWITVEYIDHPGNKIKDNYLIRGDQWMVEGDILKWDNWLHLVGLKTQYRLTRIRGRYLRSEDEIEKKPSIYKLDEREDHPFWSFLYHYGTQIPFVHAVYGNAAYQTTDRHRVFLLKVSIHGFIIEEIT